MRRYLVGSLIVGLLAVPTFGQAQTRWDSPLLLPPNAEPGLGLYLVDFAGADIGALLTWRSPGWNFGLRGGIADGHRDDVAVVGGIDFNGMLTRSSDDFPLDIDWVLGAGLGIEDWVVLSAPLGLSIGHRFVSSDGIVLLPFATPRLVLDAFIGDHDEEGIGPGNGLGDPDRDDVHLQFAFDVGLDIGVRQDFLIRFAATLAERDAVAIGLVF